MPGMARLINTSFNQDKEICILSKLPRQRKEIDLDQVMSPMLVQSGVNALELVALVMD
jgi:hypothetical protein